MSPPVAVRSIYDPTHRFFLGLPHTEGCGPCLSEHLRINDEGLGDFPELVFAQMRLPRDISRQAALCHLAQPRAQFFIGNGATQQFDLHQQVIAVVPGYSKLLRLIWECHAISMLKAVLA